MQLQGPCIHRAGTGTRRVVWARKGPYLCLLPRKTSHQPAPIKDYPTIASVEPDTDESIRAEGPPAHPPGWCLPEDALAARLLSRETCLRLGPDRSITLPCGSAICSRSVKAPSRKANTANVEHFASQWASVV